MGGAASPAEGAPEGHDDGGPGDESAGGHAIPTDNDDEQ
jgi:hypothetical protein